MGQKVNPVGFRLAVRRNWESRWYATKRDFPAFILEDYRIREFLKEKLRQAAVPRIFIERAAKYQLMARAAGSIRDIKPEFAREAHDYRLGDKYVGAVFCYYARRVLRESGDVLA